MNVIDKNYVEAIVETNEIQKVLELFENENIVDIALTLESIDSDKFVYLFDELDNQLLASLFVYFTYDKQYDLIQKMDKTAIVKLFESLYLDDIVYLLEQRALSEREDVLDNLSEDKRKLIENMLSYPVDSAGSIMSTHFMEIGAYNSVKEALELIKINGASAESIDFCFALDLNKELLGIISIEDILYSSDDTLIEEIMDDDVIKVYDHSDREEVAKMVSKYDINLLPVVNRNNKMLGIITADDVIDIIEQEATEDIQKMSAVRPLETSYIGASVMQSAFSRLPWLLILLVAYSISSFILSANDNLIHLYPVLIIFIPMLMDTTGDAGSQALAMVVRAIATDDLSIKDIGKVLSKEIKIALLSGFILFIVNMLRVYFLSSSAGNLELALTVSLTLFIVIVIAKFIGGALPFVALLFKQDPASMASPLITTLCDSITLLIYFGLASMLL